MPESADGSTSADVIPETPLLDRKRSLRGYRLDKMGHSLMDAANRERFKADEPAYLASFGLSEEERQAVLNRDWREMVRLGGNVFFLLKIAAVHPTPQTAIGAHQAGMEHQDFIRNRLGKK